MKRIFVLVGIFQYKMAFHAHIAQPELYITHVRRSYIQMRTCMNVFISPYIYISQLTLYVRIDCYTEPKIQQHRMR